MRLVKMLANLGYGSRSEVERYLRMGWFTKRNGEALGAKDVCGYGDVLYRGEELDPQGPLTILLNKPEGYICSREEEEGDTVYDLLPPRFEARNPGLNPVGRLDKDTRGLLLLTDDGPLLHRLSHPKAKLEKVYHVILDRPLEGNEREIFASGELVLRSDGRPLLPAEMEVLGEKEARVTLHEGRYHQVRRMFAALGNHVVGLQRVAIGGLVLPEDLEEGEWRVMTAEDFDVMHRRGEENLAN